MRARAALAEEFRHRPARERACQRTRVTSEQRAKCRRNTHATHPREPEFPTCRARALLAGRQRARARGSTGHRGCTRGFSWNAHMEGRSHEACIETNTGAIGAVPVPCREQALLENARARAFSLGCGASVGPKRRRNQPQSAHEGCPVLARHQLTGEQSPSTQCKKSASGGEFARLRAVTDRGTSWHRARAFRSDRRPTARLPGMRQKRSSTSRRWYLYRSARVH